MTEQRIRGNALSLEDLESAMTIHYQKLYPREEPDDHSSKDGNKIGLSAFNGVCFKCGKTGHKANNCNQAKNASQWHAQQIYGRRQEWQSPQEFAMK
jgi:hypothetical protein